LFLKLTNAELHFWQEAVSVKAHTQGYGKNY